MIAYWEEDGKWKYTDESGNPVFEKIERSGEIVGCAYNSNSGYHDLVIAVPNGSFKQIPLTECKHKTVSE